MPNIIYENQQIYLDQFNKESEPLIAEMEEYALNNNVPILDRLSSNFLEQLIILKNPKSVLEIGMAIGYSSIKIARNLSENAYLHTIEKSIPNVKLAKENIEASGFSNKITIYEGDAKDVMLRLNNYDFIFLDADKTDYLSLFELSLIKLNPEGIIFVDNLLWHGYTAAKEVPEKLIASTENIREFNQIFMSLNNFKTSILPIGDGIGLAVKI